ncbi:MAG: ribonuclease HII [Candidatus Altiarchaeota archaeon]
MKAISCGVDEAGRGPVIGPLVLACVCLDDAGIDRLKDLGVRDSKKIAPRRRVALEPEVKKASVEWALVEISPAEIDRMRKKMSLNVLEAIKTAELITSLKVKPDRIFIDATDSIAANYEEKIVFHIHKIKPDYVLPEIFCEHKADDKYVPASAASILAKVERDRVIEELKQVHGDFGSGYPSDELTQKFIRMLVREGDLPAFVRRSWDTVDKSKQSTLGEF